MLNVGISNELDSNFAQIIKLLNAVTIITIGFGISYLMISLVTSQYTFSLMILSNTVLISLVFILNQKKKYIASRLYFLILVNVGLALNCIFFGKEYGIHFFYLVSASLPFVFFKHAENKFIILSVSIAILFFSLIQFDALPNNSTATTEYAPLIYGISLVSAISWTVFNFHYVTSRNHKAWEAINEKNAAIENVLQQKDVLMQEIHHRVKNNLQVVVSLLNLQSHKTMDQEAQKLFEESSGRIRSIASVHELLYSSEDFSCIQASDYIEKLITDIEKSHFHDGLLCELSADIDDIQIPLDMAIPLGLIINEILTNSFKYAVVDNVVKIDLKLKRTADKVALEIRDYGHGFDFQAKMDENLSLGLTLIEALTEQLNGKLEKQINENGSAYILHFYIDPENKNGFSLS